MAAAEVEVYESHVMSVAMEIRAKIESGDGARLFLVSSPPGTGATFLLERLSDLDQKSSLSLTPDTFNYPIEFTGRLADAFGLYTAGEDYRKMPRYLVKAIEASNRTNIFIDDLEILCKTHGELKGLQYAIGELQHVCASVNFVIAVKNMKRIGSLARSDSASVFYLSKYVSEKSCLKFVREYSAQLAQKLGHENMPILNLFSCSRRVSDWAAAVRVAMAVALARGSKVLDMSLDVSEGDRDEVGRLLEIIAPR
ncbi:hypothetical protein LU680_14965 [Pseudomonas monteilii]|nr:hypothetical protein [Pseudomonas monteilii]WJN85589.1 hypothetical protein LU680_14965 [Pseudomonas monteilii]WJR47584.1 hypothetical protein LU654_013695 [Pseudomonas monteilii]